MENKPHILVVDDHREIRDLLSRFLETHGYRVTTAADGAGLRKVVANSQVDLIVLDLMLPGEDGLSICRNLRSDSTIPVIMLTAMGEETDRIVGLEMGADDYLAKPFNPRELLARIRAVLRRVETLPKHRAPAGEAVVRFDRWTFDLARRQIEGRDRVIVPLSTGEFRMLLAFVQHPGHVLTRDQLLDFTQGRAAAPFDRSVDTQVARLRRKVESDPANPKLIKTVWGGGYVFTPEIEQVQ